jgi:two-component sensor histidine kinase
MSSTGVSHPMPISDIVLIAADAAGVACWTWFVDTGAVYLDEQGRGLWGLSETADVFAFSSLEACVHPEDLSLLIEVSKGDQGAFEITFRLLHESKLRWISARGRGKDDGIGGRVLHGVFIDVTALKIAEQAAYLLAAEMSHRVSNLFATVSALTTISARSAATPAEMARDLTQRLRALMYAHSLVRTSQGRLSRTVPLEEVLSALLSAYGDTTSTENRFQIAVPELLIGEKSITSLALVFHELATNAVKYGSLSVTRGKLEISGSEVDDDVIIVWVERGGPVVSAPPGHQGFGSALVHRTITNSMGGRIIFQWPPDGMVASLRIKKANLTK